MNYSKIFFRKCKKLPKTHKVYIYIYIHLFRVGMCVQGLYSWRAHPVKLKKNYYIETSFHKIQLKTKIFHHKNHKIKIQQDKVYNGPQVVESISAIWK